MVLIVNRKPKIEKEIILAFGDKIPYNIICEPRNQVKEILNFRLSNMFLFKVICL